MNNTMSNAQPSNAQPSNADQDGVEQNSRKRAATDRLLTLMAAHGMDEWAALFRADFEGENAHLRFVTASLSAAIHCARFRLRAAGVTWEELRAAFDGEAVSEHTRRAVKHIGRADRLLTRLVFRGVQRQGERTLFPPARWDFPPDTRGFEITGGEMEPDYHAGEVLFVAPDGEGRYVAVEGGRGRIVGKLVGVLREA